MTRPIRNFKLVLLCVIGGATVSACSPKHQMHGQHASDQYAYEHSNAGQYSSEQYGAAYRAAGYQSQVRSRYGDAVQSASLRPACNAFINPCGFMKVVPVYPVYQIAAPVQETYVAPVEEPPVVVMPEPELPVYVEPALPEPPVYIPAPQHWPEPETPVQSWEPLRK